MKRGGPIARKTPLRNKTPLVSKSELPRFGNPLRRTPFVPKAPKVSPAERRARKLLKARSGGICEAHGNHPATDASHRVARSQGGEWAVHNLLHLCHEAHMWCHSYPLQARALGWMLQRHEDPAEVPAYLLEHGLTRLLPDGTTQPLQRDKAA